MNDPHNFQRTTAVPRHAGLAEAQAELSMAHEDELLVGFGHNHTPVWAGPDRGHIVARARTGGGKTTLARSLAAQAARWGHHVAIADLTHAHGWAKDIANVERWATLDQVAAGLRALVEHANENTVSPQRAARRLLVIDDADAIVARLDKASRQALKALLVTGRAVRVHVAVLRGPGHQPDNQFAWCLQSQRRAGSWDITGPDGQVTEAQGLQLTDTHAHQLATSTPPEGQVPPTAA